YGHDEDHGLYRLVVALTHGLNERGAHARHDEDYLHDDEPAQEPAAPPADEGDDGQERIPERMAVDDGALGEALGARRAHVVLANHLQHLRAREPRDGRADVIGLRQRRPDELLE